MLGALVKCFRISWKCKNAFGVWHGLINCWYSWIRRYLGEDIVLLRRDMFAEMITLDEISAGSLRSLHLG